MTKSEAGYQGGLAVQAKYGRDYYSAIGRKGGRPRSLHILDILPAQSGVKQNLTERGLPSSMSGLMRMVKEIKKKGGSSSDILAPS